MEFEIWKFLEDNWQDIIIALAAILISYFLPSYAQKKYFASAEKERLKQAKDSLLNLLEARIINKQDIYLDKINNLLIATEREYSVYLSDIVSPLSLLEDLELIFEKSHHLDSIQKDEYCSQIQNIVATDEAPILPRGYSEIIEALENDLTSTNMDNAFKNLELLKRKINEREDHIYKRPKSAIVELMPFLFILIVAISIVSTSLGIFNGSLFSTMYKVTIILGVIVALMAIIGAFVFGMGKDN